MPPRYLDRKGRYNTTGLRQRFLDELDPSEARADAAETMYLERAGGFDPMARVREYGRAVWGDVREDLGETLEDLGEQAVGAGRLDTGFYDVDQGDVIRRATDRFGRAISQQAVNAASLDLRNIEGMGRYGLDASNRYLDVLTGGLDRAEEEEERRRRRGSWFGRALGAVAGGAAGFAMGGPAGAIGGARAGAAIAG